MLRRGNGQWGTKRGHGSIRLLFLLENKHAQEKCENNDAAPEHLEHAGRSVSGTTSEAAKDSGRKLQRTAIRCRRMWCRAGPSTSAQSIGNTCSSMSADAIHLVQAAHARSPRRRLLGILAAAGARGGKQWLVKIVFVRIEGIGVCRMHGIVEGAVSRR